MHFTVNITGQVKQIKLSRKKFLWPLFETVVNSIQSLEDTIVQNPKICILAIYEETPQIEFETEPLPQKFISFKVTDNGNGFNSTNYQSFLEAYSQLKIEKGCKGIGRFLWLKAFEKVSIDSVYYENEKCFKRKFIFTIDGVSPEDNIEELELTNSKPEQKTEVSLINLRMEYKNGVYLSLENLAQKIIEHCLLYFITGLCPSIILSDTLGKTINLNDYYEKFYRINLNHDEISFNNVRYNLFHTQIQTGANGHELHLCANNREVKSIQLSEYIPNMQRKINSDNGSFYYSGYLSSTYLDNAVNTERLDFNFDDGTLFNDIEEKDIINVAIGYIKAYLKNELNEIGEKKKKQIDRLVYFSFPKYRLLLNNKPSVYDAIKSDLSDEKIEIELYKQQQIWESEIAQKKRDIERKLKSDATDDPNFEELFNEYCSNITDISRASLAEYIAKRKAVIDLLEKAIEINLNGKSSKEERIHKIICPMQVSSDEISYDDMNLWLIDDRLAYHRYLASDKQGKSISMLENTMKERMDIAVFDAALSYAIDPDNITSITIVELKRPQRDDLDSDDKNPITQVYDYVTDIKEGRVKKANGRGFGNVDNIAFYCYIVADITPTLKKSAQRAGLILTQDKEGYFGYNSAVGTYIEIISYDKLLKNAKQRNRVLFDKLFSPKLEDLRHY